MNADERGQVMAAIVKALGGEPLTSDRREQAAAALGLVERIVTTWTGGPDPVAWGEEVARLDMGRAGTAFVRLRRERATAPSIAAFLREYNSLQKARRTEPPVACGECDGSRWVTCTGDGRHAHYTHDWNTCSCHAVVPCPSCASGHPAPAEPLMTFTEYLTRLLARVDTGEPGAADEWAMWERVQR